MQVKISQAIELLTDCIKARLVPMLAGSPGVGKSGIVHQIAKSYGLKVIDLRLSQCDPTDLMGFPHVSGNRAGYVPMETFPITGETVPEGYNGWLLFLDEFTSAPPAVQAAAYKIVLDRKVGLHDLHRNVAIVCAGNLETDNAIVETMSTALQSRLVHFELAVDPKEWSNWATEKGVDHRITSFIEFKPSMLYTFSPDHSDRTYACPRTWEFTDKLLKVTDEKSMNFTPLLAGTLSEGVAREFIGFCRIFDDLPKPAQIASNPMGIVMPQEPSILFALTGSIGQNITTENADALMQFVKRMPVEFQVVCMREITRRHKYLLTHKAIQGWIAESAATLF